MSLQDEQLPIEHDILNQLIAATPEEWSQIGYEVDVDWDEGYPSMTAEITSPEEHDVAAASVTIELSEATARLVNLNERHGHRVKRLRGRAWLDGVGRWMYEADYEYAR